MKEQYGLLQDSQNIVCKSNISWCFIGGALTSKSVNYIQELLKRDLGFSDITGCFVTFIKILSR
jgi:hypothetical protein